jgi:hypothetical protein
MNLIWSIVMKKEIVPSIERDQLPVIATPKPVSKLAGRLVQFARDVITPLPAPAGDEDTGRSVIESEACTQKSLNCPLFLPTFLPKCPLFL